MAIEFVNRVMIWTLLLALVSMIAIGVTYGIESGVGVFLGAAWGIINLFLIKRLVISLSKQDAMSYLNIALLFGVKFPVLYLAGYWLFRIDYFPIYSLVVGFSLFFVVILFKALFVWLFEKKEVVVIDENRK